MAATAPATPTRERILAAALDLFARQGYEGTSTAQIELAAGLSPRSGALYKHFASKQELLEAALESHMREIDAWRERLDLAPLGDVRAELTLVARWGLGELERERALVGIVMKEGARLPRVVERFRDAIVRRSHALAVEMLRRLRSSHGVEVQDEDALAAVLCGSLVGFALQGQMVGRDFVDVDDERFVAAWVDTAMAMLASKGDDSI